MNIATPEVSAASGADRNDPLRESHDHAIWDFIGGAVARHFSAHDQASLGKVRGDPPQLLSKSFALPGERPWVEIGSNVEAIQVAETEFLIRGSWQYTIDLGTKNQLPIAQTQINEFAALLASAVPQGQSVKGTFDFPPSETSASGEKLTCSFRGVVRGQVPCRTAA